MSKCKREKYNVNVAVKVNVDVPSHVLLRRITSFWSSFQHEFLSQCRVNSRLVTILTSLPFSDFFSNSADRDLTEYKITQTLTLS